MSRWSIRLHLADGTTRWWHKGGRRHSLDATLGQMWVSNFQPRLFQAVPVSPDEAELAPRGSPGGLDVQRVEAIEIL
jgi:hypothetical protein